MSQKNSVFLFLIPTLTPPFETVLVVGEPARQRFVIYDPLQGRKAQTFKPQISVLRQFLADYIDNFRMATSVSSGSLFEENNDLAESLEEWSLQDGNCTRVSVEELASRGSGIFIAKYMDLITRMLVPRFDYGPESTAQDYYLMLSLELISGKLLNQLKD